MLVWSSQLAANDFPPVCAMTGQPAETWRKFRFATIPGWVYALLALACVGLIGAVAYLIVRAAVARRATGYLPLTRVSKRNMALAVWLPVAAVLLGIVLFVGFIIAASSSNSSPAIAVVLLIVGLLGLVGGLVASLVVSYWYGPKAFVMEVQPGYLERLVELRNVHPAFVMAVHHLHAARAAQSAAIQTGPSIPTLPGSS